MKECSVWASSSAFVAAVAVYAASVSCPERAPAAAIPPPTVASSHAAQQLLFHLCDALCNDQTGPQTSSPPAYVVRTG
eukprot:CAMPEP_0198726796 /NCGR_PEP_ID=MMETSP1475-20131203/3734_1 /TAXON_ID= ORGANISM="Unidentified sp., Strain CCMP1999" /NCGR_SAMPLE_ID=MMETSP1475 /ASSEMBLY_ACC=CAM_ASM_001111 /LENGTH=77 /DNA_ID=CAMNT_0044488759 /DNA_START=844 /DNA_END=1077 /DNA_ORIENTATION=-